MFASDWDEHLPGLEHVAEQKRLDASFRPTEGPDWWAGLIYSYILEPAVMRCPLVGEGGGTGYIYPKHLWGSMVQQIKNPSETILLMDSAPRHDGKRVVAFADGHVEVVAEEDIAGLLAGK